MINQHEEKDDYKKLAHKILFGILGADLAVIIVVIIIICSRGDKAAAVCCGNAILTFLITAMACIMGGIIIGFLFSIPRLNKNKDKDTGSSERQPFYKDNTNLEEISDWLTKIIVGISLVEFSKILGMLSDASNNLAYSFCCSHETKGYYAFAYCCILFFSFSGFGVGYIWTRIVFTEMLFISQDRRQQSNSSKDRATKDTTIAAVGQKNIRVSSNAFSAIDLERPESTYQISVQEQPLFVAFQNKVKEIIKSKPIIVPDDCQKKRWGGKSENNNKRITAEVTPNNALEGFFDIQILIDYKDGKPLDTYSAIIVHDSYQFPDNAIYLKKDEPAQIELIAYEAFTIGAYLEDGTELELDLNDQQGYPKEFYWDKNKNSQV
jgi:hypothetical protein